MIKINTQKLNAATVFLFIAMNYIVVKVDVLKKLSLNIYSGDIIVTILTLLLTIYLIVLWSRLNAFGMISRAVKIKAVVITAVASGFTIYFSWQESVLYSVLIMESIVLAYFLFWLNQTPVVFVKQGKLYIKHRVFKLDTIQDINKEKGILMISNHYLIFEVYENYHVTTVEMDDLMDALEMNKVC